MLIDNEGGIILLYTIGFILFLVSVYQFYKGYSNKFLKEIKNTGKVEIKVFLKKLENMDILLEEFLSEFLDFL